ncbi:MAG TPA: amidohydrolase family protein [Wenzhouxiangella sp.]|nr:amidohydrolase family protein [Wenzhouxiangella sp.]
MTFLASGYSMPARLLSLLPSLALIFAAGIHAHPSLSVIQNGEEVGTLEVTESGAGKGFDIRYQVDQNSRGARLSSRIRLDDDGFPVKWDIEGTSLMGGQVSERFRQDEGFASWSSQADEGRVSTRKQKLYVANDMTPWDLGLYARLLLQAPDGQLEVLPGGHMSIETLASPALDEDSSLPEGLAAYRLSGINLEPDYLVLDEHQNLFALVQGMAGLVVQSRYAEQADRILSSLGEARRQDLEAQQQKLAHRFDQPVHVRNVHVFDAHERQFTPLSVVTLYDNRIVSVTAEEHFSTPTDDAVIIDGEGGYVIPGLHDMHSHTSNLSGLFYLAAGVTATRDMGNNNDWLLHHLKQQRQGRAVGPRIDRSGFIEGRSEHSARLGIVADSLEEALEAVDWYAERGYSRIKLYSSVKPQWIGPIGERTRQRGLQLTGHVPAFVRPEEAVRHGYNDIAHINQLVLGWLLDESDDSRTTLRLTAMQNTRDIDIDSEQVKRTVDLMKSRDVALDTTLVILERLMTSRAGETPPGDRDYLDHMPIGYQRYRKRTFVPLSNEREDQAYLDSFDKLLEITALLHEQGIQLLPGTDDTSGFTVHRELELYTLAGIPAPEALYLGTLGAAEYLGLDETYGSITAGKRADLVLLESSPAVDIAAIKRPRMVISDGVIFFPPEIHQVLGIRPFASAPAISQRQQQP